MTLDVIMPNGHGGYTAHGSVAQKLLKSNMDVNALRTNDVLRKEEWISFDEVLIQIARQRLNVVADLLTRGLTHNIKNAMGTTILQWEQVSDMDPAIVSMDGLTQTQDDRVEFNLNNLPIYITHKDFSINLRSLEASRKLGESLDTTQVAVATRLVTDQLETALLSGPGIVVDGNSVPGYTTHPNRNTVEFSSGSWDTATGEQIVADVLSMIQAAHVDNMFGPYILYVPTSYWTAMQDDFKANSDRTIIERVRAIEGIDDIKVTDFLASDNVLMVQMTLDVVDEVVGFQPTLVQWEEMGGMKFNFKVMAIMVPRIKTDYEGRCGVVHGSTASGGG